MRHKGGERFVSELAHHVRCSSTDTVFCFDTASFGPPKRSLADDASDAPVCHTSVEADYF